MTSGEAINVVVAYLSRQHVVFTLYRAWELAPTQFRIAVHQIQPENTYRTFDVVPTDVADCWDVVEVAV